MRIGFTGTQQGMTPAQKLSFGKRMLVFAGDPRAGHQFHHGDCIGADEQAHDIVVPMQFLVIIHPPENPDECAFCAGDRSEPPKPYLDRNHDIVDATDFLIACPSGPEVLRSGTWATVRYARKKGKRVEIIMPDGSLV